jgi:2-oxo-4-hydroxy-4-carboxy--5-ureidoimidazoline (OHCU) decarboxylase
VIRAEHVLKVAFKGHWSTEIKVLEVSNIVDKVATFNMPGTQEKVWIMRKHPGLAMLSVEETEETADKKGNGHDNGGDDDA